MNFGARSTFLYFPHCLFWIIIHSGNSTSTLPHHSVSEDCITTGTNNSPSNKDISISQVQINVSELISLKEFLHVAYHFSLRFFFMLSFLQISLFLFRFCHISQTAPVQRSVHVHIASTPVQIFNHENNNRSFNGSNSSMTFTQDIVHTIAKVSCPEIGMILLHVESHHVSIEICPVEIFCSRNFLYSVYV